VIQNINKSIKIKKINSAFRQSPFYLVDIIYIFYSLLKNVVFKGFPYNKKFTIVTASDDRFFDSLTQLLENLKKYSLLDKVHLYDLGMKSTQLKRLKENYSNVKVSKFDFTLYPNFISLRGEDRTLGGYAWKPNIINEVISQRGNLVLWMDSANLIDIRFKLILIVLTNKGFFSPISTGKLKNFTHPRTVKILNISENILKKQNLTGGLVGFNAESQMANKLLQEWVKFSNVKNIILPEKLQDHLHRHDQSILSFLYYKNNKFTYLPKIKQIFGIRVNQNPNQYFYLLHDDNEFENLLYENWYNKFKDESTKTISKSRILILLSPGNILKVQKKYLNSNFLVCIVNNDQQLAMLDNSKFSSYIKHVNLFIASNNKLHNQLKKVYKSNRVIFQDPNDLIPFKEILFKKYKDDF